MVRCSIVPLIRSTVSREDFLVPGVIFRQINDLTAYQVVDLKDSIIKDLVLRFSECLAHNGRPLEITIASPVTLHAPKLWLRVTTRRVQ